LLAEYLQQYPNSARGWWMLGLAVADPRQQIDCMERVLDIDPDYAPAHARLEKLKQLLEPRPPVFVQPAPQVFEEQPLPQWATSSPAPHAFDEQPAPRPAPQVFEEEPIPQWASGPPGPYALDEQPASPRPTPRRAPARKKTPDWVLPAAVGSILFCAMFGVIGVIVIWNLQRTPLAAPLPIASIVARTLEPTWTPTASATPRPTMTPIPTYTPLPPLTLLDVDQYATAIQDPGGEPALGNPAIDFTLNTIDGDRASLSGYRGRPVLLFFWATWCPYCRTEVATLNDVHAAYKDQGLVVLAVEVGESASKGRAFRDEHGLSFPILNDSSSDVFRSYRGRAFPTNYFIDSGGNITYVEVGMMDYSSLNMHVRILLNLVPTTAT
jgi:peroxiredoxin